MQKVADPELVIGIVGRIGNDTKQIYSLLRVILHSLHYQSHHIKLTNYLKTKQFEYPLTEKPIEQKYESYINLCNHIREKSKRNDFFIAYAIESIRSIRKLEAPNADETTALRRTAFIIDQIKRPEEAEALKEIYGDQFVLISAHLPIDARSYALSKLIAAHHASQPKAAQWESAAKDLIAKDEKEANKPYGQRVSDVFPLADVIFDASTEKTANATLRRFFEALFGNFRISPTRDEYFQNIAYQASLTSCDTARQVGAAIETNGDIATTGFNEAPRAHGGTFWAEEGLDARDIALGKDLNTIRKRQMVTEIVQILRDNNYLKDTSIEDHEIGARFLDGTDAPLKKTQIMDSLEYGRAVHAEMAAITSAARNGISLKDGTLYCTTFPCHNCAKHIVASGIRKVYYLEPYAKSFADDLYPESIAIDLADACQDKIAFSQFVGITPNRFSSLFSKERLKDEQGTVRTWNPQVAQPVFKLLDQAHIEREILFQKNLKEELDQTVADYLGL